LADRSGIEAVATSRGPNRINQKSGYRYRELDITSADAVRKIISEERPDCIINTAAMTNVDACENDHDGCRALNVDAVSYLIEAASNVNAHLIHISTDFVFDGLNGPYDEQDTPSPLSFYGESKLESEQLVMESGLKWTIIRTIIIYGVADDLQRSNLVLWTKSSLEQGKTINVITDQFRSPTLAEDLAYACLAAALKKATGIFHVCGPEEDLDSIINLAYKVADFYHLDKSLIKPVSSDELNQPARRPLKTGFKIDKAKKFLDYRPHTFHEGLKIITGQLESRNEG
jgi:dTDP-4-dehydrorhamnose reductase